MEATRLAAAQPQRCQTLLFDLSNVQDVAMNLGFPDDLAPHEVISETTGKNKLCCPLPFAKRGPRELYCPTPTLSLPLPSGSLNRKVEGAASSGGRHGVETRQLPDVCNADEMMHMLKHAMDTIAALKAEKEMLAAQLNARTNVVQPTTPTHSILTSIPSPRSTSESRVEQDALVAVAVASKQDKLAALASVTGVVQPSIACGSKLVPKGNAMWHEFEEALGESLDPDGHSGANSSGCVVVERAEGGAIAEPAGVA